MDNKKALGIDLGTTFSSVCIVSGEDKEIISDLLNDKYIPSIACINKSDNKFEFLVGKATKYIQTCNPQMSIYDSKRMLGRQFDDEHIQSMINKWPFKIERSDMNKILISINQDGIEKKYEPYQISGEILKYLAEVGNYRRDENLYEPIRDVVITVPANFGEEQREETIKAAEYANLNVLKIINEPTAAGIAYSAYSVDTPKEGERYVLVYDFGGGTLDVSLLHINGHEINVTGTDGDMFLGGRDFDENTTAYILKKLNIQNLNKKKMQKIRDSVKEAKEMLSVEKNDKVHVDLSDIDIDDYILDLKEFELINKDLFDRILHPVERLLQKVDFSKEEIDSIILVGGSSKMKLVKEKLTKFFGKKPCFKIDPNDAVVLGAGYIAAKLSNGENLPITIRNIEYKDICPFSIGTLICDGTFSKIIHKNKQIPCGGHQKYKSVLYRQESFDIHIYEGENEYAEDNVFLGTLHVPNLPSSEEDISFEITFDLNENGILSAKAHIFNTDIHRSIDIPIKKINQISLNSNCNISKKFVLSEFDIFYMNIERFIKFNADSLLNAKYSQSEINELLKKIKIEKDNKDDFPDDVQTLVSFYRDNVLKKYFIVNPIPKFLR